MEPQKEINIIRTANQESTKVQDDFTIQKQESSEKNTQIRERTDSQEQVNPSELRKIEIKDNQQVAASTQPQVMTDDSHQTVTATVDPQDQLSAEEISKGIKEGNPNNALSWLSQWWNRQVKILKMKNNKS
jgi:hypothetical protein